MCPALAGAAVVDSAGPEVGAGGGEGAEVGGDVDDAMGTDVEEDIKGRADL